MIESKCRTPPRPLRMAVVLEMRVSRCSKSERLNLHVACSEVDADPRSVMLGAQGRSHDEERKGDDCEKMAN